VNIEAASTSVKGVREVFKKGR